MILGYEEKKSKKDAVFASLIRGFVIEVGILNGDAIHVGNSKKKGKRTASITKVAIYNEFGTRSKDGKKWILRPRPFMRNALASVAGRQAMSAIALKGMKAVFRGKTTVDGVTGILGAWAVDAVQQQMNKLGVVDTGLTKQSITWIRRR